MNKKAISPVIATLIIVAVAIMVAIAVAYWVTGIIPAFTRYEELKISYIQVVEMNGYHNLIMTVLNTGSQHVIIDRILVNDVSYWENWNITIGIGDHREIDILVDSPLEPIYYFEIITVAEGHYHKIWEFPIPCI